MINKYLGKKAYEGWPVGEKLCMDAYILTLTRLPSLLC